MDELREVKLEDESEDVRIQMTNDTPDGSIPKYITVCTLKRKRVESSEYANSNFAPSKNSQIFENPPKLEPLDDELVDDDPRSNFAPKPEPDEEQEYLFSLTPFLESPPKLEPLERVQESSSNLAPFFENLLDNQVKQEEEPYYQTSEQGASSSSNSVPKEPKEELRGEYYQQQVTFLNLASFLEMPIKEEGSDYGCSMPKYTIWEQGGPSSSGLETMEGFTPRGSLWTPVKEEEEEEEEEDAPNNEAFETQPKIEEQFGAAGRHCCLCGAMGTLQLPLNNIPVKSELLILAVGLSLTGKLTIERGRELMARTQSSYSCQTHYADASRTIRKALSVPTAHFTAVNAMCAQMTMERFKQVFREFQREPLWQKKTNTTARCELCNSYQRYHDLVDVRHQGAKYLLAVSSILHAYRTPTQAVLFASGNGAAARRVCPAHHRLTVNVILEHLHIRSCHEQPRIDHLLNLMRVVNAIWAECTSTVFMSTFRLFAKEQAVVTAVTDPPPRTGLALPTLEPIPTLSSPSPFVCSLCSEHTPSVKEVREKNAKLVLVVSACLSERMELITAKKFMAGNALKLVCISHIGSSIRHIREYLQIESFDETPAPELALFVTSLVYSICSAKRIGYDGFIGIVTAFAEEHQIC